MCLSLSAEAAIGTVSKAEGTDCLIERNRDKLPGETGATVESMDAYVTGKCQGDITFQDDTKVKVNENSRLVIDDFVYDPKQSDAGKLALKVGMGTVRYASGQIAKNNPQRVNIKTPTAAIAVRGTDFTMTVDEAGQSLVMLLPSCREGERTKQYELEENLCKVGAITVSTLAGSVTLDRAFEGTYVTSETAAPTPPKIINTIESKISNDLIIVKPSEIVQAGRSNKNADRDDPETPENFVVQRQKPNSSNSERVTALNKQQAPIEPFCDARKEVCVAWQDPMQAKAEDRGAGVAYRISENEHYAEVKTQGYASNTDVTIIQNDQEAMTIIGDGSPGGNHVMIIQNYGVLRK